MMSFKKQFLIIAFFVLIKAISYSQSPDFQFEHLTVEDGLSNNSVSCILQDRQGFMWFGTEQGLNRFDGYNFTVYTHIPEDTSGISANWVWCVFEDSEGFIWVGTGNGLNKFDPLTEKFNHYFHDDKRVESLSSNDVTCILEDRYGYIWIGTSHGLNKFDRKTQKFKHFIHEPNNPASISLDYISCLYEDNQGDLWIGTGSITAETSGGINKFDRKTEKFMSYKFEPSRYGHANWITAIDEDAAGNLWIGTDAGLHKYNFKTDTFSHHYYHGRSISSRARNTIKSVFIDSKDNLWSGSWGGGLSLLHKITGEFIQYKNNPQDIYSLRNNKVQTIYEDRNGGLWVGTKGGGINMINPFSNFFRHYRKYISEDKIQHVFEVNNIRSIYEGRSGKIWLGSEGEINILVRSASVNNWTTMLSVEGGSYVNSIVEDDAGIFWIGSAHGLIKYDPQTKQEKWYTFSERESAGKNALFVYALLIDQTGLLWIGTQLGLYRFDRQNDTYTRFVHDPELINTLSDNRVFSLLENSFGILWVGTVYGLNKFDPVNQTFLNSQVDAQILDHLKYNDIRVMCEDQSGNLWIGTAYGLKMFDQATQYFHLYTQKDGLPDNVINGLLPDDNGNIWISTNSGLSRFNPGTKEFKNYDYSDGIQNTTFNSGACFKNKNGEMLFGGNNGLTAFYPDSIKKDLSEPPIVITGFKKFNEEVQLDTAISRIKQLIIPFNENVFSFEFAALNFINPRKNQFAYKMEGFIDDWIYLGNKHDVNFTNLNPGKYVFRVKGSNKDGAWNEAGASVRIVITPPWWQTGWAYGFYVLLMGSVLYGGWRFQLYRLKIKHDLEIEHLHAEKLAEVDRMKSRFFANISHEFRTPLTLILGPLEKLLARSPDAGSRQELKIMQRSARRLHRLINQLLDLSRLEAGRMRLQVRQENVVALLRSFVQVFESLARIKKIQFTFQAGQESINMYIDQEKLETMINNLLSNAFKFTREGGEILIIVESDDTPLNPPSRGELKGGVPGCVKITVQDTGIGIPADRLPYIFDRFYQVDDSFTREPAPLDISSSKKRNSSDEFYPTGQEGTGIGLALTKELVEFHKGEISVTSAVGEGATFVIRLPIGKEHYAAEEIIEENVEDEKFITSPFYSPFEGGLRGMSNHEKTQDKPSSQKVKKSLPILLIVEDNADMRTYIRSDLEKCYRIIEAEDGEQGLKKSVRILPDLVISDVMMPKMDGFKLCAKLKNDERTSHIPIILLTARAAAEDKIGGLEFGADDYLTKPFDVKELRVRVKNLIEQRRKLREKFLHEGMLRPCNVAVTSTDDRFLRKAVEVVEQHLSDEEFSVALFGKEVGMSRVQLHRKLRGLTNHSASEFIRMLRLARAAQLLAQHSGNVSQIAYEVGFNNLSYFARCFHRQFGQSPSTYAGSASKSKS